MTKWQRRIKLQPAWGQAQDGEISIHELAAVVAKELRAVPPLNDEWLDEKRDEIADEFEWIAKSSEATTEDFDGWMDELYDWGDTQIGGKFFDAEKVCWIDTISGAAA